MNQNNNTPPPPRMPWDDAYDNVEARAYRAHAAFMRDMAYLVRQEKICAAFADLREVARQHILQLPPPPLALQPPRPLNNEQPPPLDQAEAPRIARRFAPQTPATKERAEELAHQVLDVLNQKFSKQR